LAGYLDGAGEGRVVGQELDFLHVGRTARDKEVQRAAARERRVDMEDAAVLFRAGADCCRRALRNGDGAVDLAGGVALAVVDRAAQDHGGDRDRGVVGAFPEDVSGDGQQIAREGVAARDRRAQLVVRHVGVAGFGRLPVIPLHAGVERRGVHRVAGFHGVFGRLNPGGGEEGSGSGCEPSMSESVSWRLFLSSRVMFQITQ